MQEKEKKALKEGPRYCAPNIENRNTSKLNVLFSTKINTKKKKEEEE